MKNSCPIQPAAGKVLLLLLLGGAFCFGLAPAGLADSKLDTVLPYTTGTRITPGSPVVGGTRYGRLIRLQHSGSANGTLIATFECWPNDFRFYRSTDDGFTWTQIAAPILSSIPGWVMKVEPDLFELPAAVGDLPAGTILLAGNCRTNDFSINSHRMEVWYSTNQGVTWQFRGVADSSTNQGMWEPHLNLTSSGQLVCYYSDERFQSSGYNQLLGGRVSPDGGLTWGAEFYVCAIPDGVRRPGMAITTKLPNGQYVLSYEGVAYGGWSQVHLKFSSDGVDWGDPADPGTPVHTASGAYIGACPYITWIPSGGPKGTLIISGQFLINTPNTDRQLFINSNFGQGNWTMVPSPVQWQGGGNNLVGWSQGMIPTADGQGLIQLASSQFTVGGNVNNNEMLVGRAQLILPGGTYTLLNQKSGLALNIPGNSAVHGVGLQQDLVTGGASQKWTFADLGHNVWTVTNRGNQLAWDDTGWSTNVGTKLEQWDYNGLPVQQFKLRPLGNGGWKFINVNAGLTVAVTNASTNAGAPIVLWTNTATAEQNWFAWQPNQPQAAYYRLDGNADDDSGNGNDGIPSATATNYVAGRFGARALQFNGVNSHVQIPRSVGGGAFLTLAFWMKTTSSGGTGTNWYNGAGLVDGEVAGVVNDFGVSLLNGKVAFGVGNPDVTLQSTVAVNDGQWHHVAVARSSLDGRMAIYLEGVLNTTTVGPLGGRLSSSSLRLGSLQTGVGGSFFNGVLDDVRLYDAWLDSNALAQLVLPPSPRAYWRFDESSGTIAADATGNGWTGTLVNGPAWVTGHDGNAVNLNAAANQYVSLPAGIVNGLTSCSIATWVKLGANGNWARIFDFGSGTGNYMFLSPVGSGNTLRFAITTAGGGGEQLIDHDTPLSAGVWHHVAVTLGAGTGILYVDGIPVGTNSGFTLNPSDLGATTQNWIGRSQYSADAYLNGLVDDFRLYSGVLAPAEVASLAAPLAAPNGLEAARGDGQISLTWQAVPAADGYNLKRSAFSDGPYTLVGTNLGLLNFTDTDVTNGTRYYYVVASTNRVTEGTNSLPASALPVSASPPELGIAFDGTQLYFSWPPDHTGWQLQSQTNPLAIGLGGQWFPVPDSDATNGISMPIDPASGSVFFRLLSPY